MTITLTYYPKELIPFLNVKFVKSRIFPEIDIAGEIFESMCDVLNEILLFYSIKKDKIGNEYYEMKLPLNPVKYYRENREFFDATKYHWFTQWVYVAPEEMYRQRLQVIQFLETVKVINVNYNPPQNTKLKEYFLISMNFYPQAEALYVLSEKFHEVQLLVEDSMNEQVQKEGYQKGILPTPIDAQLKKAMNIKYWVDFYMDGRIVLNGKHLISQPHLGTENDNFFDYIVRNPRQKVLKDKIEERIGKLKNPLSKITYDLGFTGELKKLFFPRVSNNALLFNNQIKDEELTLLGIDEYALAEQIRKLKVI